MALKRRDWILLSLLRAPLDRIHIMKILFLIWHRSGRGLKDYFAFVPYLYGPCSFQVYSELETLCGNRSIVQPPHPVPEWVKYYLTEKGRMEAKQAAQEASSEILRLIEGVVDEVCGLNFYELLQRVYAEAPDFAANSVFKKIVP